MLFLATMLVAPSSAAPIFGDGFESGNLSAWSGSASFTVQGTTVHAGAWAGRASSTGSPSHVWRTFAGQTELTATVWFNVASRSGAVWLTAFQPASGGATLLVGLNGKGKLIARNNVTKVTYASTITVANGGWHELGVHAKTGTGARFDGTFDSVAVAALSRTNNLGAGRWAGLRSGIGCRDAPSTWPSTTYRSRPMRRPATPPTRASPWASSQRPSTTRRSISTGKPRATTSA